MTEGMTKLFIEQPLALPGSANDLNLIFWIKHNPKELLIGHGQKT